MLTSFFSEKELSDLGFAALGEKVFISRKASIYGAEKIKIGNYVRIDDFTVLSGKIEIGNYVHIAVYTALFGGNAGIFIQDFANLSSRVAIYAVSDDYSGEFMTNPMVPVMYKNTLEGRVVIGRHVIVATGCTILPNIVLREGCAVGAMSLVKKDVDPWTMVAGIPAKYIKSRSRNLLKQEKKLLDVICQKETKDGKPD